jgi:hypothetical protein
MTTKNLTSKLQEITRAIEDVKEQYGDGIQSVKTILEEMSHNIENISAKLDVFGIMSGESKTTKKTPVKKDENKPAKAVTILSYFNQEYKNGTFDQWLTKSVIGKLKAEHKEELAAHKNKAKKETAFRKICYDYMKKNHPKELNNLKTLYIEKTKKEAIKREKKEDDTEEEDEDDDELNEESE